MTQIREAIDSYPFSQSLRRGIMDLRPSLAKHLETAIQQPPADPNTPLRGLLAALDELIGEWRTQVAQLGASIPDGRIALADNPLCVRINVLIECAGELERLLNDGAW